MHVFDIKRSYKALEVWKGFEQRTKDTSDHLPAMDPFPMSQGNNGLFPDFKILPQVAETSDVIRRQGLQDERSRWLRACNPPQIPPKITAAGNQEALSTLASSNPKSNEKVRMIREWDSTNRTRLTMEGQRQVRLSIS